MKDEQVSKTKFIKVNEASVEDINKVITRSIAKLRELYLQLDSVKDRVTFDYMLTDLQFTILEIMAACIKTGHTCYITYTDKRTFTFMKKDHHAVEDNTAIFTVMAVKFNLIESITVE